MLMVYNNLKSFIKYLFTCIKCNIKSTFENKVSFIIQTIFMFLNNFVWLAFWFILYYNSEGNSINGTTLNDIIYLWSVPTISYGLCFFIFGGVEDISYKITSKDLDSIISKPKHSLISLITSNSKISAMGDLIFGCFMLIFAVDFNPLKYLIALLISIIGAIGFLATCIIVQSLAFYLGDVSKTAKMYTFTILLTLTIYPENMFPKVIKILMYTLIPAMYIAHIPIKLVKLFSLKLFLIETLAIAFLMTLAVLIYNKGLKRYSK